MPSDQALESVRKLNAVIARYNEFNNRVNADPEAWSKSDTLTFASLLADLEDAIAEHRAYYPKPTP